MEEWVKPHFQTILTAGDVKETWPSTIHQALNEKQVVER
jgi:hypothetical protein